MPKALIEEYEAIVKAKDEEIAELKWDFETQKKSAMEMYCKNENIDMLKESESHFFHALIDERQQRLSLFDCLKKERKKARSIVAMLFWEWRKSEARIYATNIKWNTGRAFQSQILFEAAYKILKKEQQ